MVRVSPSSTPIGGYCAPEFASVRGQFERNFAERGEVGAAVAAWVDGQLVVNLWGGWRDGARQKHWHEDTLYRNHAFGRLVLAAKANWRHRDRTPMTVDHVEALVDAALAKVGDS